MCLAQLVFPCVSQRHADISDFSQVHLDGDPRVAWSHFIRADVFVMSPSSFSNAAAFLNARYCLAGSLRLLSPCTNQQADTMEPIAN